jgi:alginate O-acetyltransferase complex protein AlgI
MLFNSIEYITLLAVTLTAYWCTKNLIVRQVVLFLASVYFYMSWSTTFILLLLCTVGINWLIGFKLHKSGNIRWLYLAVTLNLLSLGFFKYVNFFLENLFLTLGLVFNDLPDTPFFNVILPLGISFYTFEVLSYLIDIHRKKSEPEKEFLPFALFVLFFPHLIAGPICRTSQFIPQVKSLQTISIEGIYKGGLIFLGGFVLKTGIADGVAPYVNVIFENPVKYTGADNLFAVIGFGVQILGDFWGYSLMAIGSGYFFGIILPNNFNAPYFALSIQDFWRRWHITLSNWLRDYLYISLGGSKNQLLGGLWHGASWNFVIWGAIHGLALAAHRLWSEMSIKQVLQNIYGYKLLAWITTMIIVFVSWIFFRANDFHSATQIISQIIEPSQNWTNLNIALHFFELLGLFIVVHCIVRYFESITKNQLGTIKSNLLLLFMSYLAVAYYIDGNDFIYFQF